MNRRNFIRNTAAVAAGLSFNKYSAAGYFSEAGVEKVTILYTNDTHSRIEPFPSNDPQFAGMGGMAARACLVSGIRKTSEHVLLLDAGDIFQGTAYFNYYGGEVDYRLMSMVGYDATTFGNHDFDLGCENILRQMQHARFDFINCNYDLSDTALSQNKKIVPFRVYKKGRITIGVTGVGIDLTNLVATKNVKGILYKDPVEPLNKIAAILKRELKCNYVICLSHLGYQYAEKKMSDVVLASLTSDVDLIIGGHTHTFLEKPVPVKNASGREVLITQAGWGGVWLGQCDICFSENNINMIQSNSNLRINSQK
jgi:5'-nucleotidase